MASSPTPAADNNEEKKQRRKKRNRWGEAAVASKPQPDPAAPRPGETPQQARIRAMKESVAARLAAHKAVKQPPVQGDLQPAKKKAKTFELNMNVTGPSSSNVPIATTVKKAPANPYLVHKQEEKETVPEETEDSNADLGPVRAGKTRLHSKPFRFVEPGKFQAAAEQQRQRDAAAAVFLNGRKQGHTITTVAPSAATSETITYRPDANPDTKMPLVMEWWDLELLPLDLKKQVVEMESKALFHQSKASMKSIDGESKVNEEQKVEQDRLNELRAKCRAAAALSNSKTSSLVQHIVPIRPMGSAGKKEPVLHLTKKELKRQRKLRRQEKQRKLQDLQAAGLIPAPESRLTLSNFIQVLGDQAYLDPSQMEAKVQEQMQARQKAHLERNAASKLTKEQRSAKVARKYAAADEIVTGIYRVENASHPYHRAKMDLNAQQLQLTGAVVECGVACVIVEGGSKAVQKFSRLMLVRMKWDGPDDEDDGDGVETSTHPFPKNNTCTEIWKGITSKRVFKTFHFHSCETHDQARKLLKQKGVEHYWNQAVSESDGLKIKLVNNEDEDNPFVSLKGDEDVIMQDEDVIMKNV